MRLFKYFEKITFLWCVGNSDGLEQANAKIEVLKTELKSIVFSSFYKTSKQQINLFLFCRDYDGSGGLKIKYS